MWFLTGVLFTAALSALMSAIFCRSSSWQLRGVGLSLAGSAAILVPVGIVVAFLLYVYFVPLIVADLVVAVVLARRSGLVAQAGRGMLIGLLSVPLAPVVIWFGYLASSW